MTQPTGPDAPGPSTTPDGSTHAGPATSTPPKITEYGADQHEHAANPVGFAALLGVLGVVFGDIGTSPIYALRSTIMVVSQHHRIEPWEVLGVLSLIIWSLLLIVTVKYVILIMRADHNGEGGIISLMSLAQRVAPSNRMRIALGMVGIGGACLFFGDGMITPAISVLSAVEGLEVSFPAARDLVTVSYTHLTLPTICSV